MNSNKIYLWLVVAGLVAISGIVIKYNRDKVKDKFTNYGLHQRTGVLATNADWVNTRNKAENLIADIRNDESNVKSMLALSALFIREARITGNHGYYDKAALKYLNHVLEVDSMNFEALLYLSLVQLSQHHFSDGLKTAQKAQAINPYNAFIYGMLVDAYVELGAYDSAVTNCDRMVSIRPDLRSYSRVSYLREIYGDYTGAIEAMKMAVESGVPGDESTEWARIQLGHLYENTGDVKNAEMQYYTALVHLPGYAYALAGMGRIVRGRKQYNDAVRYFRQADSTISDYSFKEEIADTYRQQGNTEQASKIMKEVITAMVKENNSANSDGHYVDRELAHAYLQTNEYDKALEHALLEYNRRPQNIDANETLAWVYYHKNEYAKAMSHINVALKTASKNPVLLCRAGLIYNSAGEQSRSKECLQMALQHSPNIDQRLNEKCLQLLQTL